jgi:hypothetical protein
MSKLASNGSINSESANTAGKPDRIDGIPFDLENSWHFTPVSSSGKYFDALSKDLSTPLHLSEMRTLTALRVFRASFTT